MKKSLRFTALMLVTAMVLALVPFTVSAASVLTSKKIVAFGDSLTHRGELDQVLGQDEYGNNIWAYSYPDYLAEYTGATVYNAGVAGNSTDDALARIDGEVLGQNPDIIVICFGMNDQAFVTATNTNFTCIDTYRKNLQLFVDKAKKAGSDVVFLTPNPVCTESGYYVASGTNYGYGSITAYCNVMREIAIKNNCSLVDAYRDYSTQTFKNYMIAGDGIHQNLAGRQRFASLVANHLKAVYDGTNKATMTIVCKDASGKQLATYTIVGASGANITVASPDLGGYTATTADINTTFVNGATHTFVYSCDAVTLAQKATLTTAKQLNVDVADRVFALYQQGKALAASANVDLAQMEAISNEMQTLLAAKDTQEKILSIGASYTTTAPNYGSPVKIKYADDGLRLTDGLKGYGRGDDSAYSVWQSGTEIFIDLGSAQNFDVINVYASGNEWGVGLPDTFAAAYSDDGETYVSIPGDYGVKASTAGISTSTTGTDGIWDTVKLSFTLNTPINARYVKVWVPLKSVCLWIDEVEVAKKVAPVAYATNSYNNILTHYNLTPMAAGAVNLHTGPKTFSNNSGNFKWSVAVVAKWDSQKNAYIITQFHNGEGAVFDPTLASDEILLAAHPEGNWYDQYQLSQAKIGQVLEISRFNKEDNVAIASVYSVYDYEEPHDCAPATDWKSDSSYHWKECSCGDRMYTNAHDDGEWHTTKNAEIGVEGEKELRCTVCNYVLKTESIPALEEEHECVATGDWKSDATDHWKECDKGHQLDKDAHDNGEWKTVEENGLDKEGKKERRCTVCNYLLETETIPATHAPATEDWLSNSTGHWQSCGCGEKLNFDSHDDGEWHVTVPAKVGEAGEKELRCTTCDYFIERAEIPALEPEHVCEPESTAWQSDSTNHWQECACGEAVNKNTHTEGDWETVTEPQVGTEGKKEKHCTVCDYLIAEEVIPALPDEEPPAPDYVVGDINQNGKLDARDYLLLKRAYFGTYTLTCADEVADINGNGKLDARDYLLLKRAYFGTYTIQ